MELPDQNGYTPLHYAMASERPAALQALLAAGANVCARSCVEGGPGDWIGTRRGSTVLHIAARRNYVAEAKAVLRIYVSVPAGMCAWVQPAARAVGTHLRTHACGMPAHVRPCTPTRYLLLPLGVCACVWG